MTLGNSFSYVPNDHYKSAAQIIHNLIKIVSRGGNYLLNIAPGPNGDWDMDAYNCLKGIGKWIKINGEGIYNSRIFAPYEQDNVYFTQNKAKNTVYAFLLIDDKSTQTLPKTIKIPMKKDAKLKEIQLLGMKGRVHWKVNQAENNIEVELPKGMESLNAAAVFKASYVRL